MPNNQTTINGVDTLIITVGTRQVGWLCKDEIIRSFGADGNIGYPRHVEELYQELELKRGFYQEKEKSYPHSARDLGEHFYNHCIYELGYDFSRVQLLLDFHIIQAAVKNGLKHIILWGTDQPEKVSWSYRRLDTLWLAKLMEGKIKSLWKNLRVDVHTPSIEANDNIAIREELEELILKEALEFSSPAGIDNEFVLWIQNKGCTPAIASGVEICAAALGRQCKVFNACPDDPESFFEPHPSGNKNAVASTGYKLISMGEYFWPLERVRVISAWKRGDFSEVQIWLKPHETRYPVLYKLAGYLSRSANWETSNSLIKIGKWINSQDVLKLAGKTQIETWKKRLEIVNKESIAQVWESSFLIDLPLKRQNYTAAFIQFAQTLERLLYLQYLQHSKNSYKPGFAGLIDEWCNSKNLNQSNNWYKLLHRIREKRNHVIHSAEPVTLAKIRSMWADDGLFPVSYSDDPQIVKNLMLDVLKEVSQFSEIPDMLLLHSLYEWGLKTLCEEAGSSHK
ncbi:MAG TPA: hypothetical protein V6D13_18565 [Halomicronema sp.]